MIKSLNELANDIHENAIAHGWWDEPRSFGEIVALCHSELSEALEEYRTGMPMTYIERKTSDTCDMKPEGIAVEMVDCIIRILDWCGKENIDVEQVLQEKMAYNRSRPYRHGGKVI